jgi:hypothetical protein
MGLFSKLKQNFNHGGVKVAMQAPQTINVQDAAVTVVVSVTASDAPAQIDKVTVQVIAEKRVQSSNNGAIHFGSSTGDTNNFGSNDQVERYTIAQAESTQMFTLAAGETKTVQLSLVMSRGSAIASLLPQGSGIAQAANVIGKIDAVANAFNPNSFHHFITAKADVAGIALDPSCHQSIQVL